MPMYIAQHVDSLKMDMDTVSGVQEVTTGKRQAGIESGSAIMALQEASQSRIRLKNTLLELALGKVGKLWYSRMKQFWVFDRWIRTTNEEGGMDFIQVNKETLDGVFDIHIKSASAMATNKSAMLDLLIRLGQTPAEDGMPLVDRETILAYTNIPNQKEIVEKFAQQKEQQVQAQIQQAQEQTQMMAQQMQEQQQQFQMQMQQLMQGMQEMGKGLQQLGKEVARIDQEHEKIKDDERLTEAKDRGYRAGMDALRTKFYEELNILRDEIEAGNLSDLPQTEEPELSDELIEQIMQLDDAQLREVLELYPELEELIQQNLNGGADGMMQELTNMSDEQLGYMQQQEPELMQSLQNTPQI